MNTATVISDELLAKLGLDLLPEEERNELLSDVGEVVFRTVMRRVWNTLSVEKQDMLLELLETTTGNDEKASVQVETFLKEQVPDFDRFFEEESRAFLETQRAVYGELTS